MSFQFHARLVKILHIGDHMTLIMLILSSSIIENGIKNTISTNMKAPSLQEQSSCSLQVQGASNKISNKRCADDR